MGRDGAPMLEPHGSIAVPPPRLCEVGPCRHYHRMVVQLDAQDPMTQRGSDGSVIDHGRSFHVETHHYCYPEVGIETHLGASVLDCNRWIPVARLFRSARRLRAGYEVELRAWKAANLPPEVAEVELLEIRIGTGVFGDAAASQSVTIFEPAAVSLEAIAVRAAMESGLTSRVTFRELEVREVRDGVIGERIDNLAATLMELGLASPVRLDILYHAAPLGTAAPETTTTLETP